MRRRGGGGGLEMRMAGARRSAKLVVRRSQKPAIQRARYSVPSGCIYKRKYKRKHSPTYRSLLSWLCFLRFLCLLWAVLFFFQSFISSLQTCCAEFFGEMFGRIISHWRPRRLGYWRNLLHIEVATIFQLGGGFKHVLLSSLFGEDSQFD